MPSKIDEPPPPPKSSSNHKPPEEVKRLALDVYQGSPRKVRQTPRPEWTYLLSHRLGSQSHRTPRHRKTRDNSLEVTHKPPESSRISMSTSTFAQCVWSGGLSLGELPGEYDEGLGTVAKHLRDRCQIGAGATDTWDEPVRMHTEALSDALGIDWTKYQANLEEQATARRSALEEQAKEMAKAAREAVRQQVKEQAQAAKGNCGPLKSATKSAGALKVNRSQSQVNAPASDSNAPAARRQSMKSGKPSGDSSPTRESSSVSPNRMVIYTRDGRAIDISMRSAEEANLLERVSGHATTENPSSSHPSLAMYKADDGSSLIVHGSNSITPRSTFVSPRFGSPRSTSTTPRPPGRSRGPTGGVQAASKANASNSVGSTAPAPQVPRANSPAGQRRLAPSASAPQVNGGDKHAARMKTAKQDAQAGAPGVAEPKAVWADASYKATHIDYGALLKGRVPAASLRDLQTGGLHVVPPGQERTGTTTDATRGAVPPTRNSSVPSPSVRR